MGTQKIKLKKSKSQGNIYDTFREANVSRIFVLVDFLVHYAWFRRRYYVFHVTTVQTWEGAYKGGRRSTWWKSPLGTRQRKRLLYGGTGETLRKQNKPRYSRNSFECPASATGLFGSALGRSGFRAITGQERRIPTLLIE